jgi:hypothetical protein
LDSEIGDIHTVIASKLNCRKCTVLSSPLAPLLSTSSTQWFPLDRERDILFQLQTRLLDNLKIFDTISAAVSEFDCLMSLADTAAKRRFVRPIITDQDIVKIRGGRHPIQECFVPAYIPNDITIMPWQHRDSNDDDKYDGEDDNRHDTSSQQSRRIVLLTGANASGKSVLLKQVNQTYTWPGGTLRKQVVLPRHPVCR